jgi:hypothetical protein
MKPYKHHSRCAKTLRGDACDMPADCSRMNDRRDDSEHLPDVPPALWKASHSSGSVFIIGHHPVSWADVKKFSWRIFKSDDVSVTRVTDGSPDFELRWVGHDAGPYPDKRMQMRAGREWSDL